MASLINHQCTLFNCICTITSTLIVQLAINERQFCKFLRSLDNLLMDDHVINIMWSGGKYGGLRVIFCHMENKWLLQKRYGSVNDSDLSHVAILESSLEDHIDAVVTMDEESSKVNKSVNKPPHTACHCRGDRRVLDRHWYDSDIWLSILIVNVNNTSINSFYIHCSAQIHVYSLLYLEII